MARLEAPRITIYFRVLSNVSNEELRGFTDILPNETLSYGYINGITGGESSQIIEFDIWNNEAAFAAGWLPDTVSDAINCTFSAWDNADCTSSAGIQIPNKGGSFVYARNVTQDLNQSFKPIAGPLCLGSNDLFSSVNPNRGGILSGQSGGDHFRIQTKIVIPPNTQPQVRDFVFAFQYDYV